jgi:hypothetical protein
MKQQLEIRGVMLNSKNSAILIRNAIKDIDNGNEKTATQWTAMLAHNGFIRKDLVGDETLKAIPQDKNPNKMTEDERMLILRWYAGSIIDVIDSGTMHGVNSLINCVDKFSPECWTY